MSRDDQFAGFAKMLMTEMVKLHGYIDISGFWNGPDDETVQEYMQIIARRAYDLVDHTIDKTVDLVGDWSDPISIMAEDGFVQRIPDMAAWPEETKMNE